VRSVSVAKGRSLVKDGLGFYGWIEIDWRILKGVGT